MAYRPISEYLNSGELSNITVKDNIKYLSASDPAAEGMFMRVGTDGLTSLYKAKNQDHEQLVAVAGDTTLTTTAVKIAELTADIEYAAIDSTYVIAWNVSNSNTRFARDYTVAIQVDGGEIASKTFTLNSEVVHQSVVLSGVFDNTMPDGSVLSIYMSAENNTDITLNGDFQATSIKLVRADYDAVTLQTEEDIEYSGTFGRRPSRRDINSMIEEFTGGAITDGKLDQNRRLVVFDADDNCYLMMYLKRRNKWAFEKLTLR
jgi:hypothetical protein